MREYLWIIFSIEIKCLKAKKCIIKAPFTSIQIQYAYYYLVQ